MPRALVAGGAGFIGSHLCERLLDDGIEVTCVDDLRTGRPQNVSHLRDRSGFRMLVQDVRQPLRWSGDVVYNLASPASPPAYQRARVETLSINADGTFRLLEIARDAGARFVLASTSEVYGDPLVHPQPETYPGNVRCNGPRSCYDEGKRYAEALVAAACHEWDVDARVARIFNTYGPRMHPHDGRVVVTFIRQLLDGEPLTVHGDGRQTRSLCYVSDLVDGLVRLAETKNLAGETVNLGNPEERSVLELAWMVARVAGVVPEIVHVAAAEDDPRRRRPDITRAAQLLGWRPRVPLEAGLAHAWNWYAAHHKAKGDGLLQPAAAL